MLHVLITTWVLHDCKKLKQNCNYSCLPWSVGKFQLDLQKVLALTWWVAYDSGVPWGEADVGSKAAVKGCVLCSAWGWYHWSWVLHINQVANYICSNSINNNSNNNKQHGAYLDTKNRGGTCQTLWVGTVVLVVRLGLSLTRWWGSGHVVHWVGKAKGKCPMPFC